MAKTFIISGGGTGGHIFPAVSIANALKKRHPNATIHFVGALGKMEMTKVPASGYPITGVPIAGINRKNRGKVGTCRSNYLLRLVDVENCLNP